MGFLENLGQTLYFPDSVKYQNQLKKDAIIQFLLLSQKYRDYGYIQMHEKISQDLSNSFDELSSCDSESFSNLTQSKIIYWGDEIEAHVVVLDEKNQTVKIQPNLTQFKEKIKEFDSELPFSVHDEYGTWMIETVPKKAYPTVCRYGDLIENIRQRTKLVKKFLKEDEYVLLSPVFPLMGVGQFHTPFTDYKDNTSDFTNKVTESLFIDDRLINQHPRFPTLTENIRTRREEKVNIQVPLYLDKNTKSDITKEEPYKNMIYMDAMAFGMGSTCLQTTFSAIDFQHARWLYDQLSILSPLFLALTAGSPIFKGKLADIDTRWDIIAGSVDDRNPKERDPLSKHHIPKSRYDSISLYISDDKRNLDEYNDYDFPLNEELMNYGKEQSEKAGISFDEKYWKHLGFLFMRDALVIFKDDIKQKNDQSSAHFENIQTTNWNSVRLKLPPSFSSNIGWRVEFRTTEISLTDDENSAISMLVHIFVRMLYEDWFKLNLYIPMSMVQENFKRSRQRKAILTQKFYFRVNCLDEGKPIVQEMTLFEIFFGKEEFNYPGLYSLYQDGVKKWNDHKETSAFCCKAHVETVFDFVKKKCTGELKTLATWQREFVQNHPDYKQDSIISQKIGFDLCKRMIDISYGNVEDENFPKLFPDNIFNRRYSEKDRKIEQVMQKEKFDDSILFDDHQESAKKQKQYTDIIQQNQDGKQDIVNEQSKQQQSNVENQ